MTTNFRRTFGDAASPLPLSYLDENFSQLENTSTSTVTLAGAGLVGYIASGSGATARTVQAKLREVAVSVTDFGATGDGSTSDTAAFQAAHDALPVYGGTIYLPVPEDSYKLSTAVSITKRCKWLGLGKLAVPIICGASNNAFNATFTGGYLEFENLYIQGDASTGTTGTALNVVGTDNSNHLTFVRVVNCYIKDFSAPIVTKYASQVFFSDIFVAQTISGVITSPVIKHSFGTGIVWHNVKMSGAGATLPALAARIGSNIDTFQATDCNIYRCGGITIDNVETGTTFAPRYIRLTDVFVESGKSTTETDDSCFYVAAGADIVFNNCTGLAGYHGIILGGGTQISVHGGVMYLNQRRGVYYSGGTDVNVRGLLIYDNSQATDNTHDAVLVTASRTKFSFKGCIVKSQARSGSGNKSRYGFNIGASCSDFEITGNTIGNMGTAAWNLGASQTDYSYFGNRVDGEPTQGSFTCAASTSTTISNKNTHAYAVVSILATDSGAAGLTGVYHSATTANTSFVITHSAAAGTETFNYALTS